MSDFRKLSDSVLASPQITPEDLAAARAMGVTMIVNNRPDGEEPSAPQGAQIEAAARAAGLDYVAIPIDHSGFAPSHIDAMIAAMEAAGQAAGQTDGQATGQTPDSASEGAVLAYCRSGTRSTFLWALAQAKLGSSPESIAAAAREAGYDVSPILPMLETLAKG